MPEYRTELEQIRDRLTDLCLRYQVGGCEDRVDQAQRVEHSPCRSQAKTANGWPFSPPHRLQVPSRILFNGRRLGICRYDFPKAAFMYDGVPVPMGGFRDWDDCLESIRVMYEKHYRPLVTMRRLKSA